VNYSLIGANGDTIAFDYQSYVLNPDFMGFNIPPAQVRIESSAGDGGVFRHAKRGVRTLDIPVTVLGTDRADVQTKLRRLAKLTQNTAGPLKVRANYSDGEILELETYYTGGAEGQWGSDAGMIWNSWTLSLQAPSPYWTSLDTISFVLGEEPTGRGLLPQLTKLKVSSDNILGVVTVNNQGDVPSFTKWTFLGPLLNLLVSNGSESFTIPGTIADGDTITVDTATGEVYNQDNVNSYPVLGDAPKLFSLQPGLSEITITGDDTTQGTRVAFFYAPRFEVVH
jgi:phage-related protein